VWCLQVKAWRATIDDKTLLAKAKDEAKRLLFDNEAPFRYFASEHEVPLRSLAKKKNTPLLHADVLAIIKTVCEKEGIDYAKVSTGRVCVKEKFCNATAAADMHGRVLVMGGNGALHCVCRA